VGVIVLTPRRPFQGRRSRSHRDLWPYEGAHQVPNLLWKHHRKTTHDRNRIHQQNGPAASEGLPVFVEYEVTVGQSYAEAGRRLLAGIEGWESLGSAAYRRGEELRSRVGPLRPLAKEVIVAVGKPNLSRHRLSLPVTWRATGAESLFPRLDGELDVSPLTDDSSRLRLVASYRPPMGNIGAVVDRVMLAGLARTTVADWVDRVAHSIEAGEQVLTLERD
jgi:hypothetical protein